ncbi:MAG: hypothetical protein JNG90_00695 [Planctomycetaceae bacterium]|nr:hypothetical protein [Planctomycetaceae bacterium]
MDPEQATLKAQLATIIAGEMDDLHEVRGILRWARGLLRESREIEELLERAERAVLHGGPESTDLEGQVADSRELAHVLGVTDERVELWIRQGLDRYRQPDGSFRLESVRIWLREHKNERETRRERQRRSETPVRRAPTEIGRP